MKLKVKIKVTTSDSCKVIVQDLSTYIPEEEIGQGTSEFKKSQTVAIDVLEINKSTGSEYGKPIFTVYKDTDVVELPVQFDGWFTVNHIILPSKEWFDTEISKKEGSMIGAYDKVYYSDGKTIYKYSNKGTEKEVDIKEVLERNPYNTTIYRTQEEYVSICFLRKCYINLCQQIFNGRSFSPCWSKNNVDGELTYKRDLAWMAINVIKYLTECEQLAEVERIIEQLHGCNGLCNSSNITSTTNGCGCSK